MRWRVWGRSVIGGLAFVVALLALGACTTNRPLTGPPGLAAGDARNARHVTEFREAGEVALRDGRFAEPAAEGSASMLITVRLLERPDGTPFARAPRLPVTRRFALRAGALGRVDLSVAEWCSAPRFATPTPGVPVSCGRPGAP